MTHDELLAKIDDEGEFLVQYFDSKPIIHSALRAVVDLHQPEPVAGAEPICGECYLGEEGFAKYPCKTIKEIQRALGE